LDCVFAVFCEPPHHAAPGHRNVEANGRRTHAVSPRAQRILLAAVGKPMLGWIVAQEGDIDAGIAQMHESTVELQKQQANLWVPQTLLLEAEILGRAKQYHRAYQLLNDAQALIEPLDQRFYEAELHRVRGLIMSADGTDPQAGAANLDGAID